MSKIGSGSKKPRVSITVGPNGMRRRVRQPTMAERIKAAQAGLATRAERKAAREQVLAEAHAVSQAQARRRAALACSEPSGGLREARAAEDEQRRQAYLSEIAARRLAAAGASGKRAKRTQVAIYKALGLDLRAGFEGRPPAFEADEMLKVGPGVLPVGVRNIARDPVHRLRIMGDVTERQLKALLAMLELLEEHQAAGLKGAGLTEAVDGGKFPDVSTYLLDVAKRMRAFEVGMSADDRRLLIAIAVQGHSLSDVAAAGFAGRSRSTVKGRLLRALNRAVVFFCVPA